MQLPSRGRTVFGMAFLFLKMKGSWPDKTISNPVHGFDHDPVNLRKSGIISVLLILLFTLKSIIKASSMSAATHQEDPIFQKGDRAPAEYFTGNAWVKPLVSNDSLLN